MNKNISKEVLEEHFKYFTFSLFRFPERYEHLIFTSTDNVPKHVAYLCPLCINSFIIWLQSGLIPSTEFSLDHLPPKSVGGTLKLITCKKCNNEAGDSYEGELIKKVEFEASRNMNEHAEIKTKFRAEGVVGNYSSFMKKNSEGEFLINFSTNLLKQARFLNEWLETTSKTNDWEVTLTVHRPDDKKILKAILKTAYLICFINWGYDFIFSSNGSLIRDFLNDKSSYPIDYVMWLDESNVSSMSQIPLGLCIITKPWELQTFAVNVPLEFNGYSSIASIFIPFPEEKGITKLREINSFQKSKPTVDITFKHVEASLAKASFDGYEKTWNDFVEQNK